MIKGFRAQVRHEIGDVRICKVPNDALEKTTAMMVCGRRKLNGDGANFHWWLLIRRRDAERWKTDPNIQMTVLHELAHAHMNTFTTPILNESHFLCEAGATVWGYLRFRHLAPKVTRRTFIRKMILSWDYYTEEVGLGTWELIAMLNASSTGNLVGQAVGGNIPWSIAAPLAALNAAFVTLVAIKAGRRAKKRGLKTFRLQGIW